MALLIYKLLFCLSNFSNSLIFQTLAKAYAVMNRRLNKRNNLRNREGDINQIISNVEK